MPNWFERIAPKILPSSSSKSKHSVPAGVWLQCPACKQTLYSKELENNQKVCHYCDYHVRLTGAERVSLLFDPGTFEEMYQDLVPTDPLSFTDSKKYKDRIRISTAKTGQKEAASAGVGRIDGLTIAAAILNFDYMGGSMGSVVGEKIARIIEHALKHKLPVLIVSASGGARMQEGTLSLMQMAKTSAALSRLSKANLPYISLLTDPTTGGVSASFAMLGDIIIAEPSALVGFAGARVIKQTIQQELPEGFQRAEFLLEHGAVDRVVHRHELRGELKALFSYMIR